MTHKKKKKKKNKPTNKQTPKLNLVATKRNTLGIHIVGNPGLLYSHALDLIGCMHVSLDISKSITTK